MIRATLGEAIPLQVQAGAGETDLYARVKLYDLTGSLVTTVSLSHIDNGLYGTTYTFTSDGHYTAVYQLFLDAGFISPSTYDIEAESVEANSDKTNILRLLGLTHDNVYIDQQSYDNDGNLTSSRVRHYDSKASAQTHHDVNGLLNTWTVTATYELGRLKTYEVVREA